MSPRKSASLRKRRKARPGSQPSASPAASKRFQPRLELLEDRTLLSLSLTGLAGTAGSGTPTDIHLPSSNVRQALTVTGTEFTLSTQVVFATSRSDTGAAGTRT